MRIVFFVAFGWLSLCAVAVATELGGPIDLSAFREMDSVLSAPNEDLPIEEVAWEPETAHRRFYVSGIIGDSFEYFSYRGGPVEPRESVFTAGGAAGVSFARPAGALRLEFEGRGRGNMNFVRPFPDDVSSTELYKDNWSTLINAWRDVAITNRLSIYAGGGIGAGGFCRSIELFAPPSVQVAGSQAVTTFAWQGGGGVIYELSNRVTLDFGYRFYTLQGSKDFIFGGSGWIIEAGPGTLSASEFLLSVRVYEPFRRWR